MSEITTIYQTLWAFEEGAMHGEAYGKRKLKNLCLWLMMKADESVALDFCKEQFQKARTMTDKLASFALLVNCHVENIRQEAIDNFYKRGADNDLVLDKWFAILASCELPGTLGQVQSLLDHPDFFLKNPNKVRALIGMFSQANHRHFHAADGSGYVFLGDMIIKIDKINPQIAAKLSTPFTRWHRFDLQRQMLMKNQLARLAELDLSRDLKEIVSKSLKN